MKAKLFCFAIFLCIFFASQAQEITKIEPHSVGLNSEKDSTNEDVSEWYFSWGYNKDFWGNTDIHVSQPSQGNDFTVHDVQANDFPGWNTGIWNKDLTEPQYSVRVGRFIDKEHSIALEFNYDHTKYSSAIGQTAHITGTIHGQPVDTNQKLTENYFLYNLHNGANHIMLNLVKRIPLLGRTNETFSLAGLGKVGAGIMLPHAENTILGNSRNTGEKKIDRWFGTNGGGWWQLAGWTAGVEVGVRFVVWAPFYLEFTDKEAYAHIYNVPVYEGTADHDLWVNELILSVGVTMLGG